MESSRRTPPLQVDRTKILRRRVKAGNLETRLPGGRRSLRRAARAGFQDSAPRAALLSLYARVSGVVPSVWEDEAFVQLWGPRRAVYVVAELDRGVFSLGTMPRDPKARRAINAVAARLRDGLAGRTMPAGDAARAAGEPHPNQIKVAGATGTILIRWDGAREPVVWSTAPPPIDPETARPELARRYLHVLGPGTAGGFARWAGVSKVDAAATFEALAPQLLAVRTPAGDGWLLARDEANLGGPAIDPLGARFLPSGDPYLLAEDRELLVADDAHRRALWPPSNVWPGGLLVGGELVGTWRRGQRRVKVAPWRRLARAEREAVEAEAGSFPLPGLIGAIEVEWLLA
jgi:Winged helix DNA-binding domain